MIISNMYNNIFIFAAGGISGSVTFLIIDDLDEIRRGRSVKSIKNISQLLNVGFYVGSASALFYIITGKPFVEYLLQ